MIQLKTHQILEDVLSSDAENNLKLATLKSGNITEILIRMSETSEVEFASKNKIRNGFMGFVIKLANLLVKYETTLSQLEEGVKTIYSSQWAAFVSKELETSNERNSRNLGGRPNSTNSNDDDSNQFETNMDNIMKRFRYFSTQM